MWWERSWDPASSNYYWIVPELNDDLVVLEWDKADVVTPLISRRRHWAFVASYHLALLHVFDCNQLKGKEPYGPSGSLGTL